MVKHMIYEQIEEGKIRVLRMYGDAPVVQVPSEWKGMSVAEIGEYCFSKMTKRNDFEGYDDPTCRELAGDYIAKVILPPTVTKVGAYAFYKCSKLQELVVSPKLTEFGSDTFMNCFALHEIVISCGMKEKTGLKQLLAQRNADVLVRFEEEGQERGEIFFPEYYELHDEIGPAHIFAMNISGEGFRARQCFQDGVFVPGDYDAIFEKACAEEAPKTLCQMALCRLKTPILLEEKAKDAYVEYLQNQDVIVAKLLCEKRDLSGMSLGLENSWITETGREELVRLATECDWVEGMAVLLRANSRDVDIEERYSLDDL